jgi:hypothetical protein
VIQSIGTPSFEESRKETPDMRSMLLIDMDEERWEQMSAQEKGVIFQEAVEFSQGLRKNGVYQGGDPLHPTSTATTVRMKNGKTVMTDGLFAETKEQLVGYSIVEAKDLDEALAIAARHIKRQYHELLRPVLRRGRSFRFAAVPIPGSPSSPRSRGISSRRVTHDWRVERTSGPRTPGISRARENCRRRFRPKRSIRDQWFGDSMGGSVVDCGHWS